MISNTCGERVYALTYTGTFLTLIEPTATFTDPFTLSVTSTDFNDVGLHPISLTVTLLDHTGPSVTVNFNVDITCVTTSLVWDPLDPNYGITAYTYNILSPATASTYPIPVFAQTPDCGIVPTVSLVTPVTGVTLADPNFDMIQSLVTLDGTTQYVQF